jgi:hypothetical protein
MNTRHSVIVVVCCLGLTTTGTSQASAQGVTTVKVQSVEVSHNMTRNKDKGVLVKVTVKQEGVVRFLGFSAAVEVLDTKDVPLLSLHAKKVIAANPKLFPNGDTSDYAMSLLRPQKNTFPGLKIKPMSILEGAYSGPWGTFRDNAMLVFDGKENVKTIELFLPLSQFPIRDKGLYELTLRARVYEDHEVLGPLLASQSDPILFTYEVK